MAKNTQPVLKRCRTLGVSPAAMGYSKQSNRNPGGKRRTKKSEYGTQLTEKQKVKFVYEPRRAQTGQRCLPSWLCFHAPRGPSAGQPRPLHRQRQARQHPVLHGQCRRRHRRLRKQLLHHPLQEDEGRRRLRRSPEVAGKRQEHPQRQGYRTARKRRY